MTQTYWRVVLFLWAVVVLVAVLMVERSCADDTYWVSPSETMPSQGPWVQTFDYGGGNGTITTPNGSVDVFRWNDNGADEDEEDDE
jgi:hypothetical protein